MFLFFSKDNIVTAVLSLCRFVNHIKRLCDASNFEMHWSLHQESRTLVKQNLLIAIKF